MANVSSFDIAFDDVWVVYPNDSNGNNVEAAADSSQQWYSSIDIPWTRNMQLFSLTIRLSMSIYCVLLIVTKLNVTKMNLQGFNSKIVERLTSICVHL
jgi:hypothetical protein